MLDILVGEMEHPFGTGRNDPSPQENTQDKQERGGESVRHHEPVITDTRSQHSDNLRITRHLGCEIDDRDEDEQRAEHIHIIRNEGQVIIKDNLLERHLVLEEIVHLLREVKDHGNREDEHNREEEGAEELTDNIIIKTLQEDLPFSHLPFGHLPFGHLFSHWGIKTFTIWTFTIWSFIS